VKWRFAYSRPAPMLCQSARDLAGLMCHLDPWTAGPLGPSGHTAGPCRRELARNFAEQVDDVATEGSRNLDPEDIRCSAPQHDLGFRKHGPGARAARELLE